MYRSGGKGGGSGNRIQGRAPGESRPGDVAGPASPRGGLGPSHLPPVCEVQTREAWQGTPVTVGELLLEPMPGREHYGFNQDIEVAFRVKLNNTLEAPG